MRSKTGVVSSKNKYKETKKMKFNVLLITFLLMACSSYNQVPSQYRFIIYDNNDTSNKFEHYLFKKFGVVIDNMTNDTIYKFKYTFESMNINSYISDNNLYIIEMYYMGGDDPPYHEQRLHKYEITPDTLIQIGKYSFGHYRDSLPSKFEDSKLTLFKGDSVIEFDLEKWEIINRYVK